MQLLIGLSTGSSVTSFVMPAAIIRPAFCRGGPIATGILPIVVAHAQGVVEQKNEPVQREDNLMNFGQTSLRIRELDPFNT